MNVITDEDIDRIMDAYINRSEIDKFSHVASLEEVSVKNDFNCNIPRYVDSFEKEETVDINAQTAAIKKCTEEVSAVEHELEAFFKELGLEV